MFTFSAIFHACALNNRSPISRISPRDLPRLYIQSKTWLSRISWYLDENPKEVMERFF